MQEENHSKKLLLKILLFLLSSLMGLVFIYSGYTKLYPIEPFEYTFVDIGICNWATAPFVARFMIGLEFFIGLLLIFGVRIKFTIKLTVGTLLFFCVYLIIMILREGNNGNCGCFGNAIAMTPVQALIKNVIMIAVCWILYKFYDGLNYAKFTKWIMGLSFIGAMAMPHILNYVDLSYSEAYLSKTEDHFELELDSLYNNASLTIPPKELSKGKHVIAFMSLTCSHCRVAAKKMRIINERNPAIPIYFVLNGEENKLEAFFEDTKTQNIPHCMLNGKSFVYLAGLNLPTIYLVNNSMVEHWVDYMHLDQSEIEKWIDENPPQ
jgi:uncharacterized membrane protein YphA (DoxX/SURF4 family)